MFKKFLRTLERDYPHTTIGAVVGGVIGAAFGAVFLLSPLPAFGIIAFAGMALTSAACLGYLDSAKDIGMPILNDRLTTSNETEVCGAPKDLERIARLQRYMRETFRAQGTLTPPYLQEHLNDLRPVFQRVVARNFGRVEVPEFTLSGDTSFFNKSRPPVIVNTVTGQAKIRV